MIDFAKYAFNKSHAAAYAVVAYQTAYLKHYYPVEFMAALMTLFFKTEIALVQCLVFYALPAFLLAGYIWPNIAMLPLMRWISYLIPLHYIIIDFRNLALTGTSGTYLFHFLILLGVSILGFFITAGIIQRRINKETHRPVNTREIIEG